MTFFDGQDPISGCTGLTVSSAGTGKVKATRTQTCSVFGQRASSAVYDAIGATLT